MKHRNFVSGGRALLITCLSSWRQFGGHCNFQIGEHRAVISLAASRANQSARERATVLMVIGHWTEISDLYFPSARMLSFAWGLANVCKARPS